MTKKTADLESNNTAEFIYRALLALPSGRDALNALASVNCAMMMKMQRPDRPLDAIQVRVMMGEMTDAVVKVFEQQMEHAQQQEKATVR